MRPKNITRRSSASRRSLFWLVRVAALVAVSLAVSSKVRTALAKLSKYNWHIQAGWTLASGVFYVFGLMSIGWFWCRALGRMGCRTPLIAAMRGYFLGHLGKYVPGKAMSVILQV